MGKLLAMPAAARPECRQDLEYKAKSDSTPFYIDGSLIAAYGSPEAGGRARNSGLDAAAVTSGTAFHQGGAVTHSQLRG